MNPPPTTCSAAIRRNPLVAAVILFLAGVAIGLQFNPPIQLSLAATLIFLILWIVAEAILTTRLRSLIAPISLALAIPFAGITLAQLNQRQVQTTHIARFADADEPIPITAHLRVIALPESNTTHGNLYWIADAVSVFTDKNWIPSAGQVRIKCRAGPQNPQLHRGDLVEVYGWLSRPEPALNPGAMDARKLLAADRIFAELRIPRDNGVILLTSSGEHETADPLTRARLFLRAKLLEQTTRTDVESADAMVALLLGRRDPAIRDISQAFADAGIAYLLAISGAHIMFFTAMVWAILRFLPLRPKTRDILVAVIVLAYVLATPCGPPVVRAAIALFMFLLGRLLARPPMYFNILAAAAAAIILFRPTDLFDAGFQLSFICTAALILLSPRLHQFLFAGWIERQRIIAHLANTPAARLRIRPSEFLANLITANLIGASAAIPLVAYHFGRINPYAFLSVLIALPAVALTMAASAMQLLLELLIPAAAIHFAPVSTNIAGIMISIIEHLAAIPGAALPVRAPPIWLVAIMYLPLLLWAARAWLRLSRAAILNAALAALITAIAWYNFTPPQGELRIEVLSVGQGSAILLQAPNGDTWLINAGSRDTRDLIPKALAPAMQIAGAAHLDGLILTSLANLTAQSAAQAIDAYHPPIVITSPTDWDHRGETYAGFTIESAIARTRARQRSLTANATINLGPNAQLRILWPTPESPPSPQTALILLLECNHRRILLLDPAAASALELLQLTGIDTRADAIILLAPQRGPADASLQKILQATAAPTLIWSGRTPWAPTREQPGELNTAAGAIAIRISPAGPLTISRLSPN